MKVLVTGASGFVGQRLCQMLAGRRHEVTAACRSVETAAIGGTGRRVVVGDIGAETDWSEALRGQDAVIHLAARAHVMNETVADPEALYRQVNVDGTSRLIDQVKQSGLRRFVFMSSIKVNGEQTTTDPFTETMAAKPEDAYGRTKWQAELLVRAEPALDATIIRAPLVYGPGVKGNFLKLLRLCRQGWPLPVGAIDNRRSLISLDNLADALTTCLETPDAIGQTFLVCDGEDVSTPDLVRALAGALGKRPWLLPVPPSLLKGAGRIVGKSSAVQRLTGSLQIDSRHIRQLLNWQPPDTLQQGLEKTAVWYQNLPQQEGSPDPS